MAEAGEDTGETGSESKKEKFSTEKVRETLAISSPLHAKQSQEKEIWHKTKETNLTKTTE